jgi:hypothetical protein
MNFTSIVSKFLISITILSSILTLELPAEAASRCQNTRRTVTGMPVVICGQNRGSMRCRYTGKTKRVGRRVYKIMTCRRR